MSPPFCDLDELLDEIDDDEPDEDTKKGETEEVDGEAAIIIEGETDEGDTTKAWVAVEGKHYILKLEVNRGRRARDHHVHGLQRGARHRGAGRRRGRRPQPDGRLEHVRVASAAEQDARVRGQAEPVGSDRELVAGGEQQLAGHLDVLRLVAEVDHDLDRPRRSRNTRVSSSAAQDTDWNDGSVRSGMERRSSASRW